MARQRHKGKAEPGTERHTGRGFDLWLASIANNVRSLLNAIINSLLTFKEAQEESASSVEKLSLGHWSLIPLIDGSVQFSSVW